MTQSKKDKIETTIENEEFMAKVRNALWTTEAFHFMPENALKYMNAGLLGYELDKEGNPKLDKNHNPIPITISRASYFRYKKQLGEMPQIYEDLRMFAMSGYTKMVVGFQEELATLHKMSVENLFAVKDPLEKQQIIDSLISKVIPTESAFADMTKKLIDSNKIQKPETKEKSLEA